jgi:[lysine-biosynthesis-protein LysW]--L-2-aminoadipate ligase
MQSPPKIGVLCSRVRVEEKLILGALRERCVDLTRIDPRQLALNLAGTGLGEYNAVLVRCLSHSRAYYLSHWLESLGVPAVSNHFTVTTCGDKMLTTRALELAGVPIPRTIVAMSPTAALDAIEQMGYPAILKPLTGSWGRLLARVNDRDAAEALIEHKNMLGGYQHSIYYIQEHVDKPGRDIRTMVAGDEVVYAIYRQADHWITNTARGGEALPCPLTPDLVRTSLAAARAVGLGQGRPGIVAVDLLEDASGRLLVNEVNHTPEFHGAMEATDADIAGSIADYLLRVAEERT